MLAGVDHQHARELEGISKALDDNPTIAKMVWQDLTCNLKGNTSGANGMTAEQVIRAAIIKQMEGFSYEDLAFHLLDSVSYRSFCRIGFADKGFQKSALCHNIKSITAETWESINRILTSYGAKKKIEKGRQTRIDCTVVTSNIHEPSDSSLLWDCVRVLTRKLCQVNECFNFGIVFTNHIKRAKRRMLGVLNAKNKKIRKQQYQDLLTDKKDAQLCRICSCLAGCVIIKTSQSDVISAKCVWRYKAYYRTDKKSNSSDRAQGHRWTDGSCL